MNAGKLKLHAMVRVGVSMVLVGGLGLSSYSQPPAVASPTTSSMSVYLDLPFVQGTYASSGTVVVEDFNANYPSATGPCPSAIAVGTVAGTCQVENWGDFGGASVGANVSAQTVGTNPTPNSVGRYASTSGTMTISFPEDQRYLGMWWTAGSTGNSLKFFKDNTLLLTVTTETIMTLLGNGPGWDGNNTAWDAANNDTASNLVTSLNNTTHRKIWYFGSPRGYHSNPPTVRSTLRQGEPFVYLHMLAGGNLTFNKVELAAVNGSGFEFDNLAVSTTAQVPNPRLVLVSQVTSSQYAVRFEPNGASVVGSMPNQVGTSPATLNTNAYTRNGFTFAGWATSADGSGTRFANSANYGFLADLTLYAQWTENSPPASGATAPASSRVENSPPASGGTPTVPSTLAVTGTNQSTLLSLSALTLMFGMALIVAARRLRRT